MELELQVQLRWDHPWIAPLVKLVPYQLPKKASSGTWSDVLVGWRGRSGWRGTDLVDLKPFVSRFYHQSHVTHESGSSSVGVRRRLHGTFEKSRMDVETGDSIQYTSLMTLIFVYYFSGR